MNRVRGLKMAKTSLKYVSNACNRFCLVRDMGPDVPAYSLKSGGKQL
jgi:hypothetical protein